MGTRKMTRGWMRFIAASLASLAVYPSFAADGGVAVVDDFMQQGPSEALQLTAAENQKSTGNLYLAQVRSEPQRSGITVRTLLATMREVYIGSAHMSGAYYVLSTTQTRLHLLNASDDWPAILANSYPDAAYCNKRQPLGVGAPPSPGRAINDLVYATLRQADGETLSAADQTRLAAARDGYAQACPSNDAPLAAMLREIGTAASGWRETKLANQQAAQGRREQDLATAKEAQRQAESDKRSAREEKAQAKRVATDAEDAARLCLKELCIGGDIDTLKKYNWTPVSSQELASSRDRMRSNPRGMEEMFLPGTDSATKRLLGPYFYARRFDSDALNALPRVKGVCAAVRLEGTYANTSGNVTRVAVSAVPVDNGRAQKWLITMIERVFQLPAPQDAELLAELRKEIPQLGIDSRGRNANFHTRSSDPPKVILDANKLSLGQSGDLFGFPGCRKPLRTD